jgi:LuxR family transcriptional activator of bioluminescence operon
MLEAFAEKASKLTDVASFKDLMSAELDRLGFSRFAHVALRIPGKTDGPFALTTYPPDWAEHYLAKDYVNHDPVLQTAHAGMQPFDWLRLSRHGNLSARQQRMMREADDFGVSQGLTIPIHGPNGAFTSCSLLCKESEREFDRILQAHTMEVHMMALYFHSALDNNVIASESGARVYLTDREREALAWTAKGKTAWEASEILSISEETINFHLKNAMKKFEVYSKHHAVVKAIMAGQIFP